jgi:hypothetical protein
MRWLLHARDLAASYEDKVVAGSVSFKKLIAKFFGRHLILGVGFRPRAYLRRA